MIYIKNRGIDTTQKTNCDTVIVILKIGLNHLKGKETTKYGITKPSAPQLPTFRNVTKSIQILL